LLSSLELTKFLKGRTGPCGFDRVHGLRDYPRQLEA
jgi:hypothetical protein